MTKDECLRILSSHLPAAIKYWNNVAPVAVEAAHISLLHGGAVYDNCYVALARQLNMPLATADRQQAQTARKKGVEVQFIA
jgi:predicted nucleic acid-binding protein